MLSVNKAITLELTKPQFLAIYEFLYHTKLGDDNIFTEEISDMLIDWEDSGVEDLVNEIRDEYGEVGINVTLSSDEGLVFSLTED